MPISNHAVNQAIKLFIPNRDYSQNESIGLMKFQIQEQIFAACRQIQCQAEREATMSLDNCSGYSIIE
jgi:hypothetical protein